MIIRTVWHGIITSCFLSSCRGRCPRLRWRPRPSWAFLSMVLAVHPGPTVAFLYISALPLSVSHGNPCTSAWNLAWLPSGMRLTTLDLMQPLRCQQQMFILDLSTRPTQNVLTQALSSLPALILSASAIFAMTTSPNGTNADSYRQPLVPLIRSLFRSLIGLVAHHRPHRMPQHPWKQLRTWNDSHFHTFLHIQVIRSKLRLHYSITMHKTDAIEFS